MEISVLREDIELSIWRYYRDCAFSDKKFIDLEYIRLDDILFNVEIIDNSMDIVRDDNGEVILQYKFRVSLPGTLVLDCIYDASEHSEMELDYSLEGYTSMDYGKEKV